MCTTIFGVKFKKLYSFAITLCGIGFVVGAGGATEKADSVDVAPVQPVVTDTVPRLTFHTDTIVVDYNNMGRGAAGVFFAYKPSISIKYFKPQNMVDKDLIAYCDASNNNVRVIRRHEFEHAKKAIITKNANGLTGYQRAQLAIMNESMAPAAEIIEIMTYRFETKQKYAAHNKFLARADELIMAEHRKTGNELAMVDFENPAIADIVLECAVDKFVGDYNRGYYHTTIKKALAAKKYAKYKGHDRCDGVDWSNYCPDVNQWGALWTFDVAPFVDCTDVYNNSFSGCSFVAQNRRRVDIWNSATAAARTRALAKIDSCIMREMAPGQMLLTKTFLKTR